MLRQKLPIHTNEKNLMLRQARYRQEINEQNCFEEAHGKTAGSDFLAKSAL
jgi:hypothetical protein